MNKWLKIVQEWGKHCLVLPCHCVLCLQPSGRQWSLCTSCESLLPWLKNACLRCALPLSSPKTICQKCCHLPPSYDCVQALFQYEWPLSVFISQLKYARRLDFGKILSHLMARLTPLTPIDCIVPMPLHAKGQRERGFNQTIELARIVANTLQLPLNRWDCTRTMSTVKQISLNAKKRAMNVSDKSFSIASGFEAKHVLVIEDVVTTGTTINAFAIALKRAGVNTVEVWSSCRTIL